MDSDYKYTNKYTSQWMNDKLDDIFNMIKNFSKYLLRKRRGYIEHTNPTINQNIVKYILEDIMKCNVYHFQETLHIPKIYIDKIEQFKKELSSMNWILSDNSIILLRKYISYALKNITIGIVDVKPIDREEKPRGTISILDYKDTILKEQKVEQKKRKKRNEKVETGKKKNKDSEEVQLPTEEVVSDKADKEDGEDEEDFDGEEEDNIKPTEEEDNIKPTEQEDNTEGSTFSKLKDQVSGKFFNRETMEQRKQRLIEDKKKKIFLLEKEERIDKNLQEYKKKIVERNIQYIHMVDSVVFKNISSVSNLKKNLDDDELILKSMVYITITASDWLETIDMTIDELQLFVYILKTKRLQLNIGDLTDKKISFADSYEKKLKEYNISIKSTVKLYSSTIYFELKRILGLDNNYSNLLRNRLSYFAREI